MALASGCPPPPCAYQPWRLMAVSMLASSNDEKPIRCCAIPSAHRAAAPAALPAAWARADAASIRGSPPHRDSCRDSLPWGGKREPQAQASANVSTGLTSNYRRSDCRRRREKRRPAGAIPMHRGSARRKERGRMLNRGHAYESDGRKLRANFRIKQRKSCDSLLTDGVSTSQNQH